MKKEKSKRLKQILPLVALVLLVALIYFFSTKSSSRNLASENPESTPGLASGHSLAGRKIVSTRKTPLAQRAGEAEEKVTPKGRPEGKLFFSPPRDVPGKIVHRTEVVRGNQKLVSKYIAAEVDPSLIFVVKEKYIKNPDGQFELNSKMIFSASDLIVRTNAGASQASLKEIADEMSAHIVPIDPENHLYSLAFDWSPEKDLDGMIMKLRSESKVIQTAGLNSFRWR